MMDMNKDMKSCGCMHHKMMPLMIVLFGLTFLLGNLNVITAQVVGIAWPSIIILGGLIKGAGSMCGCCSKHM